jgi:hypothetical protein
MRSETLVWFGLCLEEEEEEEEERERTKKDDNVIFVCRWIVVVCFCCPNNLPTATICCFDFL